MASLCQTTTNSSARDTKPTKQVSLNADVDVYDSSPKRRQSQKKTSCRLANPAYKNLSSHQNAAFAGFRLGLFGKASTADGRSGMSASKRAKKADGKSNDATLCWKYYNLVKAQTNEDYEDTLTSQYM